MQIVNLYHKNGKLAFTGFMFRAIKRLTEENKAKGDVAKSLHRSARDGSVLCGYTVKISGAA